MSSGPLRAGWLSAMSETLRPLLARSRKAPTEQSTVPWTSTCGSKCRESRVGQCPPASYVTPDLHILWRLLGRKMNLSLKLSLIVLDVGDPSDPPASETQRVPRPLAIGPVRGVVRSETPLSSTSRPARTHCCATTSWSISSSPLRPAPTVGLPATRSEGRVERCRWRSSRRSRGRSAPGGPPAEGACGPCAPDPAAPA